MDAFAVFHRIGDGGGGKKKNKGTQVRSKEGGEAKQGMETPFVMMVSSAYFQSC